MIIVDENVDQIVIDYLNRNSYDILSIRKSYPGITDREIIELAKTNKGFVITEDKDFGELIFAHQIEGCSVIFLRHTKSKYQAMLNQLDQILIKYLKSSGSGHFFIKITPHKTRIKKL